MQAQVLLWPETVFSSTRPYTQNWEVEERVLREVNPLMSKISVLCTDMRAVLSF